MGKKSATKVEAAPAAIKATKPLKKGKREPEDDLDTKVNLKKQKKDLVAAVQKEKAEKKVPKKVESSDEESDSEEEDKATKVPAKKAPVKAASSSEESDSDESSSDEEPAQKKATNGTVAKKAKDESSSEEESSDEEEVAVAKKPAAAKPAAKDSSSSEDDSEDESEDEKPSVAAKAASSSDSSEEDSDEESEDEKPAPKKAKEDTKTAKKDSNSDESGDSVESESEDEEETPKKKSSDVEMVDAEKKQPKTPSTPATGGTKTLFVANLPFQVEKSDVEEFFKEAGQVVDVRFATNKEDGSFRGFGHVEFASAAVAQKALEFHGRPLLGRELRLDVAQERGTPQSGAGNFKSGGGGGGAEVFVKGFDSSLSVDDIRSALTEHFASCGEITRVSVPRDYETGASKGIAFLEFSQGRDKALELDGSEMGGWNLTVNEPKPRENNNSGERSSYGGGRDNFRGRGRDNFRGRGRDNFRGRGRGRDNFRGRSSFTPQNKKTTFSDE